VRLQGDGARLREFGVMMRIAGDTIALSPPLVITQEEMRSRPLP
jgi:adenosylmethionine-8-amino-7-oxononanoate aminotransferase